MAMRITVLVGLISAVAVVTVTSCGKRPVTRTVPVFPSECRILPAPVEVADTITVALFDTVEPGRAPWADNASEELLFHHLYETLITVDCLGDIQAGLAESWVREDGGRCWTFKLREDARFWDGGVVTARDVVLCWQDALTLDTAVESADVAGNRLVRVYLKQPYGEVPRALSAPVFAVTKPSGDPQRLIGTGPYRLVTAEKSSPVIIALPAFDSDGPVIRFVETSVKDARDLLEGGIDMLTTIDPTVIEYAASQSQLTTIELPWDETYVFLSTSRVRELRTSGTFEAVPLDLLDRLARDAVRHDARGHRPGAWWDDLSKCGGLSVPGTGDSSIPSGADASSVPRRILYDSSDAIARGLAERIVALAATDPAVSSDAANIISAVPGLVNGTIRTIAVGVGLSELDATLRHGDDFAYIVSVPRQPPDPCFEAHVLVDRVPWLRAPGVEFTEALLPLVDARAHLVVRTDCFGLMIDGYGRVLIVDNTTRGE